VKKADTHPPEPRQPVEHWAQAHGTPTWLLAATRAANGWAIGREVTEQQFLSATQAFADSRVG
jgi:uncharacterized membrane protein AbrB (regulator of aidB expression)